MITKQKEEIHIGVSIILPVFNGDKYIRKAIRSVLKQSFSNLELIIVDDCSTDSTFEIISTFKSYDSRIKIIKNKERTGNPAVNRNIGIKESSGQFVAFIDHDDMWFKKKLERQLSIFKTNKNIDLVHSNFLIYQQYNSIFRLDLINSPYQVGYSLEELNISNSIILSSVVIRKSTLDETGLFNINKIFVSAEDYELWLRVARTHKLAFCPEIHGIYINRKNSLSNTCNVDLAANNSRINQGLNLIKSPMLNWKIRLMNKAKFFPQAIYLSLIQGIINYNLNFESRYYLSSKKT